MDALNALREATVSGAPVVEEGEELVMGEARFPVSLVTPVLTNDGSHYPLGSLFVTFKFAGEKNATRLAEYKRLGVARVHYGDNKKILAYLRGQTTGDDIVDRSFAARAAGAEAGAAQSSSSSEAAAAGASGALASAGAAGGAAGPSSSSSSSSASSSAAHMAVGGAAHLVMGAGSAASAAARAGDLAAEHAATLHEVLRREVPVATRNSVLSVPGADLRSTIFDLFSSGAADAAAGGSKRSRSGKRLSTRERLAQAKQEKEAAAAASRPSRGPSSSGPNPRYGPRGAAIIIVPNASSSLITLHNAPRLLKDMYFVPPVEAKAAMRAAGTSKPWKVTIERQTSAGPRRYHIMDSVDKLQPGDWDKVVAIFTHGADWQFKGWRWGRAADRPDITPVEVFDRTRGFFLHYEDEPVPPSVRRWRVDALGVSRSQRHLDTGLVARFWKTVDDFVSLKKPFLMHDTSRPSAAAPPAPGGATSSSSSSAASAAAAGGFRS